MKRDPLTLQQKILIVLALAVITLIFVWLSYEHLEFMKQLEIITLKLQKELQTNGISTK